MRLLLPQQLLRFVPTFLFIDPCLMDILQAAKAYEEHCAKDGKPDSHAKAKEIVYVLFVCVREIRILTLDTGLVLLVPSSTGRSRRGV